MTTKIRRNIRQLSVPLAVPAVALFASGLASGWFSYLGRSPGPAGLRPRRVGLVAAAWRGCRRPARFSATLGGGTSAGSAVTAIACGCSPRSESPPPAESPGPRPPASASPSGLGRALLALPPAALFLYAFYRAGEQVTGGLDPNFTVNAWGGPTYLGAMACHYLDLLLLMAAASWLLNRVLLPDPASTTANSAAPGQASAGTLPRAARTRELDDVSTHS